MGTKLQYSASMLYSLLKLPHLVARVKFGCPHHVFGGVGEVLSQ